MSETLGPCAQHLFTTTYECVKCTVLVITCTSFNTVHKFDGAVPRIVK